MHHGKRNFIGLTLASALFASAGLAGAADYPERPIELVVPVSAGGGTDAVARAFAESARMYLPQQPFLVTNKPGASGAIGMAEVVNAKPDGYKLGLVIVEMTILPYTGTAKFKASDFTPIARLNADPGAITVRADAPWNTIEEFIAHARKNPGAVQMGEGGTAGNIWNIAAVALEEKAQIKVNHVPFPGASPAVIALLGGHVDAVSVSPGEVSQHVAAGKLKTLALMSDKRWGGVFEKVPTFKERGMDINVQAWRGLAGPKNMPPAVVAHLQEVARKSAADPFFRTMLEKATLGWSYADAKEFQATIDQDDAFYSKLIPKLGIKN
jgi:tripartite-type tricarboxylate transporter receptor subunit TctC